MVLQAACGSEGTLVSVNENAKAKVLSATIQSPTIKKRRLLPGLRPTSVQVPATENNNTTEPLHLPRNELFSMEDCLQTYPGLMEQHDALFEHEVVHYGAEHDDRYVYIHQGELGHATSSECDVLVSDRATTCHVLAFWSTSSRATPLSSLTHLDGTGYGKCLQEAIAFHRNHHHNQDDMRMDVHVVGGFLDDKEHSAAITRWLFHFLADVADRETRIQFRLCTACVTALNDRCGRPRGRGMAIHCATGRVTLAKATCLGPLPPLRAARIWSNSRTLHTVHSTDGRLRVPKFAWKPVPDYLVRLPDATLLDQCSTSPDAEEEDFCQQLRATFLFLKAMTPQQVFGHCHVLQWERRRQNMWVPV